MPTYNINGRTYKIGEPINMLEKHTCNHIEHHARGLERNKRILEQLTRINDNGMSIDTSSLCEHIIWHENCLEKFCKEYQNPLKVYPLKK